MARHTVGFILRGGDRAHLPAPRDMQQKSYRNQTGDRRLLACCHHNLGSTPIRPTFQTDATVDVSSAICCSFAMCKSDPGLDWQTVVAGPVRAAQQAFSEVGISRAISSPWGRTYQSAGKPSVPHLCDTFMFRAKVSKADILQLLQKSGFNYVFLVPRDDELGLP